MRGPVASFHVSVAILTWGLLSVPAHAQVRQDSVLIHGQVLEESPHLPPIPGVSIKIEDRRGRFLGRTQTDQDGRFTFVVRRKYGVFLKAERIGYEDTDTPFLWFDNFEDYQLELRLHREAVLLAPLEIVARKRRVRSVLDDFHHRLQSGLGRYITREEIEARNASSVTSVLALVPGVHLASSGTGSNRVVQMRGGARAGRACPVQVYMDGVRLNASGSIHQEVPIDSYVSPEDVFGIEVYRGLSSVPAQFLSEDAKCGVVAIWTRRGAGPSG